MMMMSFGAIGLIGVLWVLYGYAIAFRDRRGTAFRGRSTRQLRLLELLIGRGRHQRAYPTLAFVGLPGDLRDHHRRADLRRDRRPRQVRRLDDLRRASGRPLVYFPVASWVLLRRRRLDPAAAATPAAELRTSIDFAGGTAVHINAGAAALALALVLGKRVGFAKGMHDAAQRAVRRCSVPRLLWFGWFGFNAGLRARRSTALAASPSSTRSSRRPPRILGWLVVEKIKDGKPTSVGAASGAVAGLVAITPACAILTPGWALVLGLIAGCGLRPRDRAEVQARLRRLARRGGHPPRRWPHRNAVPRLLRHRHRPDHRRRASAAARPCRRSRPSAC